MAVDRGRVRGRVGLLAEEEALRIEDHAVRRHAGGAQAGDAGVGVVSPPGEEVDAAAERQIHAADELVPIDEHDAVRIEHRRVRAEARGEQHLRAIESLPRRVLTPDPERGLAVGGERAVPAPRQIHLAADLAGGADAQRYPLAERIAGLVPHAQPCAAARGGRRRDDRVAAQVDRRVVQQGPLRVHAGHTERVLLFPPAHGDVELGPHGERSLGAGDQARAALLEGTGDQRDPRHIEDLARGVDARGLDVHEPSRLVVPIVLPGDQVILPVERDRRIGLGVR